MTENEIKNSQAQFSKLASIDICNLFLRDSYTRCAFPYAIKRRIFCTLFQPSLISTNGARFALWASRNPGQADFASFGRGNAVNVPGDFLARETWCRESVKSTRGT